MSLTIVEILQHMSPEQLTELQQAIRMEKRKRVRPRGKFVTGYISKDNLPFVDLVMDWLHDKKFLKKKNLYNLTTFALATLIQNVRAQIKNEAEHKGT